MRDSVLYVVAEGAPKPGGHYSQAALAGDLLYISGQLPIPLGARDHVKSASAPFGDQAMQALRNLLEILDSAGGTPDNLVKVTAYIVGSSNWAAFNDAYAKALGNAKPARAVVPVPNLHHGYLVEVEAVAAGLPSQGRSPSSEIGAKRHAG